MQISPVENAVPERASGRGASVRTVAVQGLKLLVAVGAVVYLVERGDIAWEPLRASLRRWELTLPAFLLLALMPLAQLWRWQSLLRASQLHLPHREVFSFLMVSKFFNMAFPGYISGDILRGFYVSRSASGNRESSQPREPNSRVGTPMVVASIVLDRIAGLIPLFTLCLIGLLGSLSDSIPREVILSVGTLATVGLLAPLLLFVLTYRKPELPAFLVRLVRWPRVERFFSALYGGAHRYARNLKLIRNILAISFLNQGLAISSFILFGWALELEIPVMTYLMLVPLGLLVTAIPVSPAGLGVGQVAFLALFHLAETSQGANLFTLYMASFVVINLAGAVLYLFPRMEAIQSAPASKQ